MGFLRSCEPTVVLNTILATYVDVNHTKDRGAFAKTFYSGALLTSASLVGVGAVVSEGLTLIGDLFCHAGKGAIRGVQYIIAPTFLSRLYETIPTRRPISYRIERIVSQALGAIISSLSTFFLIVLPTNWPVRLHSTLFNYHPRIPALKPPAPPPRNPVPSSAGAAAVTVVPPSASPPVRRRVGFAEEPAAGPPPPPPPPSADWHHRISPTEEAAGAVTVRKDRPVDMMKKIIELPGGKTKTCFIFKGIGAEKKQSTMARFMKKRRERVDSGSIQSGDLIVLDLDKGGFFVQGIATIHTVAKHLNLDFHTNNDRQQVGAYLIYLNEAIPKIDEDFEIQTKDLPAFNFSLKVTDVDPEGNINQLFIQVPEPVTTEVEAE